MVSTIRGVLKPIVCHEAICNTYCVGLSLFLRVFDGLSDAESYGGSYCQYTTRGRDLTRYVYFDTAALI